MKGLNEIKTRIGGVSDTVKITKAMYLISTAKMPALAQDLAAAEIYRGSMDFAVGRLASAAHATNPYLAPHPDAKRTGYIVIAGDKGLSGDYNHLVLDAAWEYLADAPDRKIFAVGYMAKEFFKRMGVKVNSTYMHMMQHPLIEDAGEIADRLMRDMVDEKLKEVYIIYTRANKLHDQKVVCEKLLPLPYSRQEEDVALSAPNTDVTPLIRAALCAIIYDALLNAAAALNYKHMTSMQKATKNGEEMLEDLKQNYNHARQSAITAELIDVNVARMANEDIE